MTTKFKDIKAQITGIPNIEEVKTPHEENLKKQIEKHIKEIDKVIREGDWMASVKAELFKAKSLAFQALAHLEKMGEK